MKNNQSGQSTIEFIFSFIFAVSLILLVFNTSLNYASGYVTHYATYMAGRVFMVQDSHENVWGPGDRSQAIRQAEKAFQAFNLNVFGINAEFKIHGDENLRPKAGEYLMIGAVAKFSRKMDVVGQITGQSKLELISESFLGREPTRGVCASRICKAIGDDDECDPIDDVTLFDDGC
jgi:hypothetical protein